MVEFVELLTVRNRYDANGAPTIARGRRCLSTDEDLGKKEGAGGLGNLGDLIA